VSRETFVELLEATPARPPGFVHVGFEVDDMNEAAARLQAANVKMAAPRAGRTRATVAEVEVPDGVNVELLQLGTDSMQRKAVEGWIRLSVSDCSACLASGRRWQPRVHLRYRFVRHRSVRSSAERRAATRWYPV